MVEMQNGAQPYFYDRGIYYLSRAISNQGEKGKDWKFSLCPVYGIFLLNYKMGINSKFRTDVILADRDTGRMFSDKIRQVYLELPWFTKEPDDCETDFERWLYLLKHMDTLERMPFKARKAVFDKLLEVADVASLSRDERIQSIKQSGDSLRRSRLIFLNYLPVITRLFHDYLPDCLAGLDDVEAGGQIAAVQTGDRAEVVQQPSVGGDDADGRNGIRVGACAVGNVEVDAEGTRLRPDAEGIGGGGDGLVGDRVVFDDAGD